MSVWALYFGWPAGEVWPNLVAAAIGSAATGALVAWRALRRIEQKHAEHEAELAAHRQALAEDVSRQLADHHAAVLAAVAPKATGGPVDPSRLYHVGDGDGCVVPAHDEARGHDQGKG